jgi:hypothetical protein
MLSSVIGYVCGCTNNCNARVWSLKNEQLLLPQAHLTVHVKFQDHFAHRTISRTPGEGTSIAIPTQWARYEFVSVDPLPNTSELFWLSISPHASCSASGATVLYCRNHGTRMTQGLSSSVIFTEDTMRTWRKLGSRNRGTRQTRACEPTAYQTGVYDDVVSRDS